MKTKTARKHQGEQAAAPHRKPSLRRKPPDMKLEDWQIALRREFGRAQAFRVSNVGQKPVFSEFAVHNPKSGGTYRVAIRGSRPGANFCSCPDFAVNTLGTCKHIEYVLGRLEQRRGYADILAGGYHPPYSEVFVRYGSMRQVVFRAGTECPAGLRKFAARYFDGKGVLKPEACVQWDAFTRGTRESGHEVRCYDDATAFVAQMRDRDRLARVVDGILPQGADSAAFNTMLNIKLYPYQRAGALFAARASRVLIADDMGLGKTVQAVAAAEILARAAGIERVLVIAPTSLKHQWKQEIARFTDRPAEVIEGLIPARKAGYDRPGFFKITNYDVLHRDEDLIRRWNPDLIILDEAQRVKNWKTRAAQSLRRIPSPHLIVLTGTPLQNRLEELHAIVELVDRHHLGPLFRFLDGHQQADEAGRVIGYRNLSGIGRTLAPIMIRRTKEAVLKELPQRLDKNFMVPMTPEQTAHHDENREIVVRIVSRWRKHGYLSEADQVRLTCALQNMRMACNSTYLLDQTTDHGVKAGELITLLGEILERPEEKVVVFSQWVRTHEILLPRIEARQWGAVLFHGGVPGRQRGGLIRTFKEDPKCRIFLSTDAGGVGLNLQNAATVVNMDLPWNPAILDQRIGRVHRIGQSKPVRVVNFVAQGTIEHGMLDVLSFKKSLFAGVLDGGQDEVFLGGTRLKRFMESVERVATAIPPAMPPAGTDGESGNGREGGDVHPSAPGGGAQPDGTDGLGELLEAGAAFVADLAGAVKAGRSGGASPLIGRDEKTGTPFLKLPVPRKDIMQKIAGLLAALTGMFKPRM
ncbi:MAG: DEAD/DEAH box helicase [Planctomycetota bacterium]